LRPKIKTILIGHGYWGTNLLRNLLANPFFKVVGVVDSNLKALERISEELSITVYSDVESIPDDLELDLIVISTNPKSHLRIFSVMSKKSRNFLITKPVGASKADCQKIEKIAELNNNNVFIDFTYHFSPLYRYMWDFDKSSVFHQNPTLFTSYRTSLGIYQKDISVVADLMVHDLYIILKSIDWQLPTEVVSIVSNSGIESNLDSAFAKLSWGETYVAEIHVSWNSPKKIRMFSRVSGKQAFIIEELSSDSPIQVIGFDSRDIIEGEEKSFQISKSRIASAFVPEVHRKEPLGLEFEELAYSILGLENELRYKFPTIEKATIIWGLDDSIERSQ